MGALPTIYPRIAPVTPQPLDQCDYCGSPMPICLKCPNCGAPGRVVNAYQEVRNFRLTHLAAVGFSEVFFQSTSPPLPKGDPPRRPPDAFTR